MEMLKKIIWFISYIGVNVPFIFVLITFFGGLMFLYKSITDSAQQYILSLEYITVSLAYFISYHHVLKQRTFSVVPGCFMLVVSIAWTYLAIDITNKIYFFSGKTAETFIYSVGIIFIIGSISNIILYFIELKTKKDEVHLD